MHAALVDDAVGFEVSLEGAVGPGADGLQAVIAGARVMLVSATPFQLSANGLTAMLAVGEDPNKHLRESERVQNSDAFMRELVPSTRALRASKAWDRFVDHANDTATGRRLRRQLEEVLFSGAHPKVEETAKIAVRRSREGKHGRHVLIFCYFRATPEDIKRAITAIDPDLRVVVAANEARARRAHQQEGFGLPTSKDNPPMILIVGERLSESVDLDGGRPIIIHHDLSWSPIRFDQRMGRVVRASSGFQMVSLRDVVIPVLAGGIDQRMYDTLKGRRLLAHTALGGVDDPQTLGV